MTKRSGAVPVDLSSISPRAARRHLQEVTGSRLRGWIMRAEVRFTEVAQALGMQRTALYDVMEGVRSFNLAWFPLLPEAVQRVALADLALEIGHELRPVAEAGEDRDCVALIHGALDTIRTITSAQADGAIDAREAREVLDELARLEESLAKTKAHCRTVIAVHEERIRSMS